MNRIREAFDIIRAEDSLKKSTMSYLHEKSCEKKKPFKYIYRYAAACAAVLLVIFGTSGYNMLNTAVSYISIDVNPSIELALNRFNNVIEASAYNDEGNEILQGLNLKGQQYTEAIDSLFENGELNEYLNENSVIDFTVVSDKQEEIIEGIQGCNSYGQHRGYCHSADKEMASKAREHGLSTGKYRAYTELSQYNEEITEEDCRDMTMKQIYDMIKEYSGDEYPQKKHHGQVRQHNRAGHHGESVK